MRKARSASVRTCGVDSDDFTGCEVNGDSSIDTTARSDRAGRKRILRSQERPRVLVMEETVYYSVIAAMIVFGLYAGNRWARSMGQAVLLGLAGSAVAVATFVCL